jgi:hypothetical protein
MPLPDASAFIDAHFDAAMIRLATPIALTRCFCRRRRAAIFAATRRAISPPILRYCLPLHDAADARFSRR